MKLVFFTASLVALMGGVTHAQQFVDAERALSIEQLVALALDRSPTVLAARARVDAARGDRVQAGLRPNPTLMSDWREQIGGADRQTMIGVSLPLDLFRRPSRVAVADSRITLAEAELADLERRIATEVKTKAVLMLGALRQLQVRERMASTLRQLKGLVEARASSGAAPPLERDLADVDARRAEADELRQQAAVEAAFADLRAALGIPADEAVALREDLEQMQAPDETSTPAGSTRTDIRVAEDRLRAASSTVDLIRHEARPDVDVTASYMRMKAGYPLFAVDSTGASRPIEGIFHNLSIGASITLPFRNQRQGDLAAANAAVREAEQTLEASRRRAAAEVQAAEARVTRLTAALAVYQGGLRELAGRNVDVVRQSYELGRATLLDVLNETRRLLDTEMAYTDLLIEVWQARIDLAGARGAVR